MTPGFILLVAADTALFTLLQAGLLERGTATRILHAPCVAEAAALLASADSPCTAIVVDAVAEPDSILPFLDALRGNPQTSGVPVLVVGDLSRLSDVQAIYARGANAYFPRHTSLDGLIRTLLPIVNSAQSTTNSDKPVIPLPIITLVTADDFVAMQIERVRRRIGLRNRIVCYETAASAAATLRAAARLKPSSLAMPCVVLLDLSAPDASHILASFQTLPGNAPALIGIDSASEPRAIAQAGHLGVRQFLSIPIKPEELRLVLSSVDGVVFESQEGGGWPELA